MLSGNTITISVIAMRVCLSLVCGTALAGKPDVPENGGKNFMEELARIREMERAVDKESPRDLAKYETFADEVQHKWRDLNKTDYAHLMLAVCSPLSSGMFKDTRQYELARKYALSALENADAITVILEMELTGHLGSLAPRSKPLKDKGFARLRRKDVEVLLHAWKRSRDAMDPNWDPDEKLDRYAPLPPGVSGFSGMSPEVIKDKALRAQYEAATMENAQKIRRYNEQYKLRNHSKAFQRNAERYIVSLYSRSPDDVDELNAYLKRYLDDDTISARIIDAVKTRHDDAK